jgi:predicted DNA binding CopG/RHH family protein
VSKKLKPTPVFKDEAQERRFWETHVSTNFLDWSKAKRVRLPHLKPSTTAISLRLPLPLLERIKVAANKRDVSYQSLIKTWLAEKVNGAQCDEPLMTVSQSVIPTQAATKISNQRSNSLDLRFRGDDGD